MHGRNQHNIVKQLITLQFKLDYFKKMDGGSGNEGKRVGKP